MRSVPIQNLECSSSPIEQLNQITHWLDNSNIYGSLPEVATSVRSNQGGLLKSTEGSDNQEQLPIDPNPNVVCSGETTKCALAGNLELVSKNGQKTPKMHFLPVLGLMSDSLMTI